MQLVASAPSDGRRKVTASRRPSPLRGFPYGNPIRTLGRQSGVREPTVPVVGRSAVVMQLVASPPSDVRKGCELQELAAATRNDGCRSDPDAREAVRSEEAALP